MANGKNTAFLEKELGFEFKNRDCLQTALTHSSYANESRAKGKPCDDNERLEFLGDAVLQIYISDFLFSAYPDFAEGTLTQMRQQLVCEGTLAALAHSVGLGDYIRLGKGEEQSGGRSRPSVLADAFEAVLAAMYLDDPSPDHSRVRKVLLSLVHDEIKHAATVHTDYKSRLQQLVQQDGSEMLSYETVSESGPAHDKVFCVEAKINSNKVGEGTGKTKREAEQNAARVALALFGVSD